MYRQMNINFSKQLVNALKLLKIPLFSVFLKQLNDEDKLKPNDIENELLKYIGLNIPKLKYMMINIKKKKKIEKLETKKFDALEELDENLSSLRLRNTYFRKRPTSIGEETELRNAKRKKIDEIDRLETELKSKEELKYIEDYKNGELLSDVDYDKEDILHEIN